MQGAVQLHINQYEKIREMFPEDSEVVGINIENTNLGSTGSTVAVRIIGEESIEFLVNINGETFNL